MPRNDVAASSHVCPGMRMNAIPHSVIAPPECGLAVAASRRRRTSCPRSDLVVLVMMAPPHARLVAPLRRAVEPLIHAPEPVESARIGGVGVVDDAVFE